MSYPYSTGGAPYPQQGGGYPPQAGGYPPALAPGGYPPQGGYLPAAGGYPPAVWGYPTQPAAWVYPPAPAPTPGYPPAPGGGYPPQQLSYPPASQPGYPPQQPGYPAQPQDTLTSIRTKMSDLPSSPTGYVLQKKLGQGGFGKVFKAKKPNGNICALKAVDLNTVPSEHRAEAIFAWDREVAVLVKTSSHKYIVAYHGSFSTSDKLWLEMEYCSGGSLQTYYYSNGISRSLKRQFMIEIADAIDYLHGQRIIHRDLKPDNVLIQLDGSGNPYAKLADFGTATASLDGNLNKYYMSSMKGTAYYLAPEVYNSKYTVKADIFSLGVLYMTLIRETSVAGYLTNYAVDANGVFWATGRYMNMTNTQLVMNTNAFVGSCLRDLVNSMILLDYQKRPTAKEVNTRLKSAISDGDFDDNPRSRPYFFVSPPHMNVYYAYNQCI